MTLDKVCLHKQKIYFSPKFNMRTKFLKTNKRKSSWTYEDCELHLWNQCDGGRIENSWKEVMELRIISPRKIYFTINYTRVNICFYHVSHV